MSAINPQAAVSAEVLQFENSTTLRNSRAGGALASPLEGPSTGTLLLWRAGDERGTAGDRPETRTLLMITSIAGAGDCAARLGTLLNMTVDVVPTRRESLGALRGRVYAAVIVDDAIAESDPQGAEMLRRHAGSAVVLEVNFAISGVARLARQVRGEMQRRAQENTQATRLVCAALANDLKETVAGLLLHSQLALAEPSVSPQLSTRLQQIVGLAGELRQRLDCPPSALEDRPAVVRSSQPE